MRLLLAATAALIVWIAIFVGLFAASAGIAWIFLFGDDPWPDWSNIVLILLPALGALPGAIAAFRTVMERKPAR
jgi:apolipoprotein N-acyltransferase